MPIDPGDVAICVEEEAATGAASGGPGPSPMAPPIVQTSLFAFPTFRDLVDGLAEEGRHPVYTRGSNPTVEAAERKIAALERGDACRTFGSGMGAIAAVLLTFLRSGDHVLFLNQVYGPTLQLARHLERFGVEHDVLTEAPPDAVRDALRPGTRMAWMESPGTMTFRMLDVPAIAELCRERGVLTCLDNSWASPLFQKPLTVGVDLVVHSATKYLAGHSDLVAGAVAGSSELVGELFGRGYMLGGAILAPFDAWLLYRGIRTLPVRLRQHEADALEVAAFLRDHAAVRRVHHPGLAEGPEAALVRRQLAGTSGLFSIELEPPGFESVRTFLDGLERFSLGVSWGGVESLAISPENGRNGRELTAKGLPRGLVRLSVGLEGAGRLIEDLDRALAPLA